MIGATSATQDIELAKLRSVYETGERTPSDVVAAIYKRISARGEDNVWIHLVPEQTALDRAKELEALAGTAPGESLFEKYPLYGTPFAVKDNIDVANLPTTAACPDFAYTPDETAPCVQHLIDAGAILIGKTNLDQFALGLVGVRSPYGTAKNPFDENYIPGGSSSGSGVAVSAGLVSFALGTDTAGSGRVPAGFNNVVGLKPTRGLVSTRGVVPACRTLDCVSVFGLSAQDALDVLKTMAVFDPKDAYSRPLPEGSSFGAEGGMRSKVRAGVPRTDQLDFFGDEEAKRIYEKGVKRITDLSVEVVEIDFAPFDETAKLVYGGPWMAERLAAIEGFIQEKPDALYPVTRELISSASNYTAVDAFRAQYRLEELKRAASRAMDGIDFLLVPTTPTIYTVSQIDSDPIRLNANLGTYTNFVNLLDLCAVAVPNGFYENGLPAGITLIAPAFEDSFLCNLANRLLALSPVT